MKTQLTQFLFFFNVAYYRIAVFIINYLAVCIIIIIFLNAQVL